MLVPTPFESLLWNTATWEPRARLKGHEGTVMAVRFAPDGISLASCSHDRTVRIWETETGRERVVLNGDDDALNCLAWAPDGRTMAAASVARRRLTIEKRLCVVGEFVAVPLLLEDADDGERVCQNADAARRGLARIRELGRRLAPRSHQREQIKFDGRPQSFDTLIGADRVENQRGGRSLGRHCVFSPGSHSASG
jgi:WD domain, G-beta repeat